MPEPNEHLLVVDDDAEIRELLADYLCRNGFTVETAANGAELFRCLERADTTGRHIDLVILDIMMPGADGLTLCRTLRESWSVPVIFLTALDSITDRVVGLEIGADDYVVKPFATRELLARIRTVLRRHRPTETQLPPPSGHWLCFASWTLNPLSRELRDPTGIRVELSDAQYRLLMIFLEHPFQVLSRDTLLTRLHGREQEPFDRSVDIQVSRLRNRLRDLADTRRPAGCDNAPPLIRTVRGGGYMLAVSVERQGEA